MRVAILMAGGYAVGSPYDGRRAQICYQAEALERSGHEVIRLNPWESYPLEEMDAVHVVEGGLGNTVGAHGKPKGIKMMGMAPFIDTNIPAWLYRMAAELGSLHPRLMTLQGLYQRQACNCEVVIARSSAEKRILTQGLGIPACKVKLVLNGVNPARPVDVERLEKELGIKGDFVFHLSMFTQARKNVARLIEAIEPLKIPLVIAGTASTGEQEGAVYAAAKRCGRVRILGTLTALQRDSLYAACRVFCLPSMYEGTGLVALEAASHGAAVVITERGGPPDYFGDMADYVDPRSVKSIRAAIQRAWERPRDGRLAAHVTENLSWEASARALAGAYGWS